MEELSPPWRDQARRFLRRCSPQLLWRRGLLAATSLGRGDARAAEV